MTTTAEVLTAARDLIRNEKDWCKYHLLSPDGRRCIRGALSPFRAQGAFAGPHRWLYRAAQERGFPGYIAFNDHHATTHADVLDLFDRAIALAKEEDA